MISTMARLPSRTAEALTMVRSARAMRPCLPITFPTSSFSTESSNTTVVSVSVASTWTSSGLSTSALARCSSRSFNFPLPPVVSTKTYLLVDALDSEQPLHRPRGLDALRQPLLRLLGVDLDERGLGTRVVLADGVAVSYTHLR